MKKLFSILAAMVIALPVLAQTTANLAPVKQALSDEELYSRLDAYIQEVKDAWKIRGMVVQIGDDKNVLFSKGYGNRGDETETKIPMDEHTLFQIASVSKSFTTAVIASLVDEGLIKWTDRVIDILPDFKMYDPWVTEHAQIMDFTCHRSGLEGNEGGSGIPKLGYDKPDIMHLFQYWEPRYVFRGEYQYNNNAFVIPALITEKVTGKSWSDNVRERIYEPLGMTESMFRGPKYAAAFENGTASTPYKFLAVNGEIVVEPYDMEDIKPGVWRSSEAAGGIISTPRDMLKWAQFHLNEGVVDGRQVISKEQMRFLHTGMNMVRQDETGIRMYAQAWMVEQSKKCRIIWHTGTNAGQIALCAFLPDLNRTFTLNANTRIDNSARFAILYRFIDLFLGLDDYDYSAKYLEQWHKDHPAGQTTEPILYLPAPKNKAIVGRYVKNEDFGDIEIKDKNGQLWFTMVKTGSTWPLRHISGDVFVFHSSSTDFKIQFSFTGNGKRATGLHFISGLPEEFGPWTRK